jgi:glycosyl hydrolase family 92
VVNATVGVSFVSVANAQNNASAEAAAFATVRGNANNAWNTALNRVQATGGSATDLQKFYTALYHVMENPNVASDTNGQYMGFDGAVHTSTFPIYQNYSGWDIYRSWASLMALIAPDVMTDIVKSMVLDGQQGGLLPKWSQQTAEDFVMPGDPGPIIVGSAYAFGVRNFDAAAALALMKKSATGGSTQGVVLRGNEGVYESAHFIPGNPSETLEYASSAFAIAQFAKAVGDSAAYATYSAHSQYWRSLFNGESGYIHSRNSDGSFPWPLNPAQESPYTEGNAAQYTWMVPHNLSALITLMGGATTAAQRLDHHFTELNGGLVQPYFYIGNEPEHNVPWTYNFARQPAGASAAVRRIMAESFTTGAGGLPGNDDLGATSAWYVWASIGLYPVTPGADTLAVHGALFPNVLIQRPGGNITLTGGSATNQYVQSLTVNGSAVGHNYLRYGDVAGGATIAFSMGAGASSWGTGAADVPPSFGDGAAQPPAEPDVGPNLALKQDRDRHRGLRRHGERRQGGRRVDPRQQQVLFGRGAGHAHGRSRLRADGVVVRGQARRARRRGHELEHRRVHHRHQHRQRELVDRGDGHPVAGQPDLQPDRPALGALGAVHRGHPDQRRQRGVADLRARGVRQQQRAGRSGVAEDGHRRLVLRRRRGSGQGGQRQRAGRVDRQVVLAGREQVAAGRPRVEAAHRLGAAAARRRGW